ncbi:MAG: M24 family metallopeptidase [Vicinamibacterales bacterium]|nr:M24 family metallopeptidase [Vicinamibacterales bacterium]
MRRRRIRVVSALVLVTLAAAFAPAPAPAQESRRRFEMMRRIRLDKFDLVLPGAMRENGIDMWIVAMKQNHPDPLWEDLGGGFIGATGYFVFTDRGGRIEKAVFDIDGLGLEGPGGYDLVNPPAGLTAFVRERDPKRIGVNMSDEIGAADGLTYTHHQLLVKTLGEPYASRLVSAETLVSDFRSRRVATEIVAFGEAAQHARELAERALSNEIVTPGKTTLEDVAWWMQDRLLERGLGSSFGMPSVYWSGPEGILATSDGTIIRPGMLLHIDWGVCLMNLCTDMKRTAYVLKADESKPPAGIQFAWDQALKVREVIRRTIRPGVRAIDMLESLNRAVAASGFSIMKEFNKPSATPDTEVIIGCHSIGNTGHGSGPSMATWQARQSTFVLQPSNMIAFEFFAWTPAPEWGGNKVRIPFEDDAIVTERGVEWLAPVNERILLIKN